MKDKKHEDKIDQFGDKWVWSEDEADDELGTDGGYVLDDISDGWLKHEFGDSIWWMVPPDDRLDGGFYFSFDKKKSLVFTVMAIS